jgi:general secretion pathway protein C
VQRLARLKPLGPFVGLAICAYLCAGIVTTYFGEKLMPVPTLPSVAAPKAAAPKRAAVASLAAHHRKTDNPANLKGSVPIDKDVPFDETADLTKSSLNAHVLATVLFDHAEWDFAQIEDGLRRTSHIAHVGETLFPKNELFTVERIEDERVVIRETGATALTYLERKAASSGSGSSSRKASSSGKSSSKKVREEIIKGIKAKGTGRFDISRASIDTVLSNLNVLSTDARVVPDFKNGTQRGFKLFSIKPNSVYSKIGLKNGDVLSRINGYDLSSPDKILEVYGKLKDSEQVTVELLRRGKPKKLDYSIR